MTAFLCCGIRWVEASSGGGGGGGGGVGGDAAYGHDNGTPHT